MGVGAGGTSPRWDGGDGLFGGTGARRGCTTCTERSDGAALSGGGRGLKPLGEDQGPGKQSRGRGRCLLSIAQLG